jgi:hypothetical protein
VGEALWDGVAILGKGVQPIVTQRALHGQDQASGIAELKRPSMIEHDYAGANLRLAGGSMSSSTDPMAT